MKRSASESKQFQSRSKVDIPGQARREERLSRSKLKYTLFLYKNVVFSAEAEYSYFFADFRLKIFLYYS